MATGPEHYREAERLREQAEGLNIRNADARAERAVLAAEAQVHATLALAAATALNRPDRSAPRATIYEWAAWQQAAGVPTLTDD